MGFLKEVYKFEKLDGAATKARVPYTSIVVVFTFKKGCVEPQCLGLLPPTSQLIDVSSFRCTENEKLAPT